MRAGLARRRRVPAAVVAMLAALTAVAGCASLPDHSAVQRGRGEGARGVQANVSYQPPGPRTGASRQQIVRGYLDAMLAAPPDPSVVREFLTPQAAQRWTPGARLLVYQQTSVGAATALGVDVQADPLGHIDGRGSWTSAGPGTATLNRELSLEQVGGEWRISDPFAGTLVDSDYFDRHLHQYSLYFFDPTHKLLSPDPVYLPVTHAATTANSLVSDLLEGPTASMQGVVQAGVPPGTQLARRVTVSPAGLAVIDLTRQALSMSSTEAKFFAAQLVWTLRPERVGVTHIRLLAAGRQVQIPGLSNDFAVDNLLGYNPAGFNAPRNLYALAAGHLVSVALSSGANHRIVPAGPIGLIHEQARSAAVQLSGPSRAALVVDNGTQIAVGSLNQSPETGAMATWFKGGHDLLRPSWDVHGLLWVIDRTSHGAVLWVVRGPKVRHRIMAPGISGTNVRSFAVSRDGDRLAALVGTGSASHLVLAMIQRSSESPVAITVNRARAVRNAQYPLVDMTRLAWYSPTVVAVLARDRGGEPEPYQISIDGSRVVPTTGFLPVVPVSLATVGDPRDLGVPMVVGTADGRLYSRDSAQHWVAVGVSVKLFAPVYPG